MEEAGVDIISDGEMQRHRLHLEFPRQGARACAAGCAAKLGYPGPDQLDAFLCVEPFSVPGGYGTVAEWQYARTRTNKPLISTLQARSPRCFRHPGKVYKNKGEVAWRWCLTSTRMKQVVAAGWHVQFDEPAWILPGGVAEIVDIFNACVEGVNATVGFHLCFGNFRAGRRPRIAASPRSPHFRDLHVDVLHIEFANRNMYEAELWQKYGGEKILSRA